MFAAEIDGRGGFAGAGDFTERGVKGWVVLLSCAFDGVRAERKLGRRAEAPPHSPGRRMVAGEVVGGEVFGGRVL